MNEEKINHFKEQIKNLKKLPRYKEVSATIRRLQNEISKLESKEKLPKETIPASKAVRSEKISKGLSKHFRYLRLIRNNFPDIQWAELREQFSRRRKGLDNKIPDAIWQNPSP